MAFKKQNRWDVLMLTLTARSLVVIGCCVTVCPKVVHADESKTYKRAISDNPIVSSRANSLGGAVSNSADNFDAMYFNPSGISGNVYHGSSAKEPFIRQVYLPRVGLSVNENAVSLQNEFTSTGAVSDANKGSSVMKSHDGAHQYARVSVSPVAMFMGNLGIVPVLDQQISAIPSDSENSDVTFHYRSFSGALVGTGINDPKGTLSLGVSSLMGTIEDTKGSAPYQDMVDIDARREILNANRKIYTASATNIGAKIKLPKKWNPTLSLTARNVGNANHVSTTDSSTLRVREDLTAAIGVAPRVKNLGRVHFSVEGAHLTNRTVTMADKFRTGLELTFGDREDNASVLALRTGYNSAGATCGAQLNLGLIGVEASSHGEDIGDPEVEKNIERRSSISIFIDAGSF